MVILGHGFWQRRFGSASDVVGRAIELNEEPWEIVGVMPRGFAYPVGSTEPPELDRWHQFSRAVEKVIQPV